MQTNWSARNAMQAVKPVLEIKKITALNALKIKTALKK